MRGYRSAAAPVPARIDGARLTPPLKPAPQAPINVSSRHGQGGVWVHGRTKDFFRKGPRPVLFDTTQLALQRAIEGASLRQTALANNLANANTPGLPARGRRLPLRPRAGARVAATGARPALERTSFSTQTDGTGAVRADGSTVDPDAEAAKLAANALEHQAAVQVAATRNAILTIAMGAR